MKQPVALLLGFALAVTLGCTTSGKGSDDEAGNGDSAVGPTFDASVDSSFVIVPGERIGPIHSRSSEADLIAAFGEQNVRQHTVYLTEGFCTLGTRVFGGTPDELQIAWRDSLRTRIAMVRFDGEGARWHTKSGVRIGTTLKELEEISGEVIEFSGFGWDLAGGCEWGEPGASAKALGLQLGPDDEFHNRQDPRLDEVYGDRLVRSDHPVIRSGTIVVRKIFQNWGWPYVEMECF